MRAWPILGAAAVVLLSSSPLFSASNEFQGYGFEAYVVKESGQRYREFRENRQTTLKVRPNEEYSIVVRNPLPVRVAVAVTLDGLNSIDGQRTTPRAAKKWMIEPRSSLTISGWQTSRDTLRKFVFTQDTAAYAQWKETREGKPYTKNLGVIGVAWFWNRAELHEALHPPKPQPFIEERGRSSDSAPQAASKAPAAPGMDRAESRAGTGMGEQRQHSVKQVEFNPDAGMFSVKDVLKIFYEFAQDPSEPLPFVDDQEDAGRFAPDMHQK